MTKKPLKLSIISPAHNEASIVALFVEQAISFLKKNNIDGEVVIIENGSIDDTLSILKQLAAKHPRLVVDSLPVGNKGEALKLAMKISRGELLVTLDTDLWDEKFVLDSLENLKKFDVVVGSKTISGAKDERPLSSRLLNLGYNFIFRLVFNFMGTETHALLSFRRDKILPLVNKCSTSELVFDTELIILAERAKLSKIEIPSFVKEVRPRRYSLSSQLVKTVKNFLKLTWAIGISPNWNYLLVFAAIVIGAYLRFHNYNQWFFFNADEEHYAYMTRMISVDHHFPAIGGPISGTKLYMAPWFLYFNAIWYFLSNNSPLFSGVLISLLSITVIPILYLIGKKLMSSQAGAIAAFLYATSFHIVLLDRHQWNISLVPLISVLTFWSLENWFNGKRPYLSITLTALILAFGISTTFSVFAIFLFALFAIIFFKKPYLKKDIVIFLGIVILSHSTIILFDLRHNWWFVRAFWEFLTQPSYASSPLLERISTATVSLFTSLGKTIVITNPVDVTNETSICNVGVSHYVPMVLFKLFALVPLGILFIAVFKRFGTQRKQFLLIILLLIVNFVSLFLFRADPAERHWLPFYPFFFLLIGVAITMFYRKFGRFILIFPALIFFINLYSFHGSWSSYGWKDRESAVRFVISNTTADSFFLNVVGECHSWGYRYMFSWLNHEPAESYMDAKYEWMYSKPPRVGNSKVLATILVPDSNSTTKYLNARLELINNSFATAKFGNVEVYLSNK